MRDLKARLSYLKMEEVVLERELDRAREGLDRYKQIEKETDGLLDACRTAIINLENTLDAASTMR